MNSVLFPTEPHSWEILNPWYFPFCFSVKREVPPHPATHKILKMNSTWHTSHQLQKAIWCESCTSFKSRAASESIQRRKTVVPQKITSVSRNSFLNCRGNALLMWNASNYSHFTSSNVTYSHCTHLHSLCNFPPLSASLLSGSMALQSSWKMLVVHQYITFKDTVVIPVWEYCLPGTCSLHCTQFQRTSSEMCLAGVLNQLSTVRTTNQAGDVERNRTFHL